MRILLYVLGLGLLVCGAFYGVMSWKNNRSVPPPTHESLAAALEHGIQWLDDHQESLLSENNPMLWWMVQQSAGHTQNARLTRLFSRYRQEVLARSPNSAWRYLFDRHTWLALQPETLQALPDYNLHFLYGLSCDTELGTSPLIQQQLRVDFCPEQHPVSPACTTHQLMGMRFMQDRGCGDPAMVEEVIHALQERIETQLRWDPRPVDVYLQRVLMLIESGQAARIKPVWLQRVLDAQRPDGGWSDFYPLVELWGGKVFGINARFLSVQSPRSSFHATAQGVLLLALLQAETSGVARRQN